MGIKGAVLVLAGCLTAFHDTVRGGVIFSQDFSSSPEGPIGNYVHSPPSSGQWDVISWGTGATAGVNGGEMWFTRNGTGTSYFSRVTDFSPIPTSIIYSFDLSVSGNTATTGKTSATFQVGSGFGTTEGEINGHIHSRFGISLTSTPGSFQFKDLSGSGSSATFSGHQTITWVINNSGAALTYLGPNNSPITLANNAYDLWTNTNRVFNGVGAVTPGRIISDFEFVYNDGYGTIHMDNISIRTVPPLPELVPEPGTTGILAAGFISLIAFGEFVRRKGGRDGRRKTEGGASVGGGRRTEDGAR